MGLNMLRENYNSVISRAMALLLLGFMLATLPNVANAATRKLQLQGPKLGEQPRFALVIGNSVYASSDIPRLANPTNDAHAMAEALNKLNFQVIEVTNATQKEMNKAISNFGEGLEPNTIALFYYAGHGLQVKGKNYLVPVDADISRESSVSSETVDMDNVLEQLGQSKVSIVILDACRNNPFKKSRSVGGDGGLAQMAQAPMGSFIAYATSPGRTAADGTGTNGVYTQELIKHISRPGMSIEEVFKSVRVDVSKATSGEQTPWETSSMTGSFYFNGAPSSDLELAFWGKIKDSESIASFDTYLTQYPNGKHVKEAEQAKERLLRKQQVEQAKREEEANRLALEREEMRRRQDEDARNLANERQRMEEDRIRMQKEGVRRPAEPPPYVPPAF